VKTPRLAPECLFLLPNLLAVAAQAALLVSKRKGERSTRFAVIWVRRCGGEAQSDSHALKLAEGGSNEIRRDQRSDDVHLEVKTSRIR
jgi:hypothetical protein